LIVSEISGISLKTLLVFLVRSVDLALIDITGYEAALESAIQSNTLIMLL